MVFFNASKCLSKMWMSKKTKDIFVKCFPYFESFTMYMCFLHTHLLNFSLRHEPYLACYSQSGLFTFCLRLFFFWHFISLHMLLMILAFRQFSDSSNYFALNNSIEVNKRFGSPSLFLSLSSLFSFSFLFTLTHKQWHACWIYFASEFHSLHIVCELCEVKGCKQQKKSVWYKIYVRMCACTVHNMAKRKYTVSRCFSVITPMLCCLLFTHQVYEFVVSYLFYLKFLTPH